MLRPPWQGEIIMPCHIIWSLELLYSYLRNSVKEFFFFFDIHIVLYSTLGYFHISIFASRPRGLIFLKTVEEDDTVETKNLFVSVHTEAALEVGPTNVLQIPFSRKHLYTAGCPWASIKAQANWYLKILQIHSRKSISGIS